MKNNVNNDEFIYLFVSFLVGIPIGFDLEVIGRITGTEIFLIGLIPLLWMLRSLPPVTWPIKTLLILTLVWFCGQLISDIVNETEVENMARGIGRALITTVLILGYFTIIDDSFLRIAAIFLGTIVGLSIGYYYNQSDYYLIDPWKFGYGNTITMVMIFLASIIWGWRAYFISIMVCLLAFLLNLYMGYRSMAGMAFMTAVLIGISVFGGSKLRRMSRGSLAMSVIVLVVAAAGITEIYSYAARSGLLRQGEAEKYAVQAGGAVVEEQGGGTAGVLGVLLSGRAEILVSSQAILDRPLLGHGSWVVNSYYAEMFRDILYSGNYETPFEASDIIPTHSHLFGAWVEGGVLSILFWLYVIGILGRAVIAMIKDTSLANPIVVFLLISVSWAVLFSPYGLTNRAMSCLGIVAAATVVRAAGRGSTGSHHPMMNPIR